MDWIGIGLAALVAGGAVGVSVAVAIGFWRWRQRAARRAEDLIASRIAANAARPRPGMDRPERARFQIEPRRRRPS